MIPREKGRSFLPWGVNVGFWEVELLYNVCCSSSLILSYHLLFLWLCAYVVKVVLILMHISLSFLKFCKKGFTLIHLPSKVISLGFQLVSEQCNDSCLSRFNYLRFDGNYPLFWLRRGKLEHKVDNYKSLGTNGYSKGTYQTQTRPTHWLKFNQLIGSLITR